MPDRERAKPPSLPERLVEGALLLNLHFAARLGAQLLEQEMAAVGVRPEFAGLLTEIRLAEMRQNEPLTPTELARRTGVAPATLYDYLEQLVAQRLVKREPNPKDGRSHLITLTPKGVKRVQAVSAAVRAAHERFLPYLDVPLRDVTVAVGTLRFAFEDALNADATH